MLRAFLTSTILAASLLTGCAPLRHRLGTDYDPSRLLPADAILLGEQHDAPEHQQVHLQVVKALILRDRLAALALEMAEQGTDTRALAKDADEAQVRAALRWDDRAWPWALYGPAVMATVREGIPVFGANLPRGEMRVSMAKTELDGLLPADALQIQRQAIQTGHCDLLPEAQIAPMTRIQIARDRAMAETVAAAARRGQAVLLLAGGGHVDRVVGVPRYLPQGFKTQSVRLQAGGKPEDAKPSPSFNAVWVTPDAPDKDHCADLRRQLGR